MLNAILLRKLVSANTILLFVGVLTLTVYRQTPLMEFNFLTTEAVKAETINHPSDDLPVVEDIMLGSTFPTSLPVMYLDNLTPYGKRLSVIDRSPFPTVSAQLDENCPDVEPPTSELISIWSRDFIKIYTWKYTSHCNMTGQPGAVDIVVDGKNYPLPIFRVGGAEYPGLFAIDPPLLKALQNISSERVEIRMYGSELEAERNPNDFTSNTIDPSTVKVFQAIYDTPHG